MTAPVLHHLQRAFFSLPQGVLEEEKRCVVRQQSAQDRSYVHELFRGPGAEAPRMRSGGELTPHACFAYCTYGDEGSCSVCSAHDFIEALRATDKIKQGEWTVKVEATLVPSSQAVALGAAPVTLISASADLTDANSLSVLYEQRSATLLLAAEQALMSPQTRGLVREAEAKKRRLEQEIAQVEEEARERVGHLAQKAMQVNEELVTALQPHLAPEDGRRP
jgi:hypothetical protein